MARTLLSSPLKCCAIAWQASVSTFASASSKLIKSAPTFAATTSSINSGAFRSSAADSSPASSSLSKASYNSSPSDCWLLAASDGTVCAFPSDVGRRCVPKERLTLAEGSFSAFFFRAPAHPLAQSAESNYRWHAGVTLRLLSAARLQNWLFRKAPVAH